MEEEEEQEQEEEQFEKKLDSIAEEIVDLNIKNSS
jgi:hypothetical protein